MKTFYFMLLFLAGILVLGSCEKQETIVSDQAVSSLKSANLMAKTILVEPAGPMYDTKNLMEAFAQAKEAGPGAVIQLTEGDFYLDQMIINDFRGTFKGSAKDKTIVHTIPGGINLQVYAPFIETNSFFLDFHGGDFTVSDMSFVISDDNPVKPYDWWTGGDVTFLGAIIRVGGSSPENYTANTKFQNLSFSGKYVELFDFTPYNVDNAIEFGGSYTNYPMGGNQIVQNCEFSTCETGINAIGLANGELTIGGSPHQSNFLTNTNTGISFWAGDHMNVKISNNKMEAMQSIGGIWIYQENIPPDFNKAVVPSACNFLIQNNVIELVGPYPDGIAIYDIVGMDDPAKQSKAHIQGNLFKLSGGTQSDVASQTAIYGYSLFNTNASQNIISGKSLFAFFITGVSTGCDFKFNDFSQYNSEWIDIWLRPYTSDNKVICETDETTVYDESGLNTIKGPAKRGKVVDLSNFEITKNKQHGFR